MTQKIDSRIKYPCDITKYDERERINITLHPNLEDKKIENFLFGSSSESYEEKLKKRKLRSDSKFNIRQGDVYGDVVILFRIQHKGIISVFGFKDIKAKRYFMMDTCVKRIVKKYTKKYWIWEDVYAGRCHSYAEFERLRKSYPHAKPYRTNGWNSTFDCYERQKKLREEEITKSIDIFKSPRLKRFKNYREMISYIIYSKIVDKDTLCQKVKFFSEYEEKNFDDLCKMI